MEIPLFRLRIVMLIVSLFSIAHELMTEWVSQLHKILAAVSLIPFAVFLTGILFAATCGFDAPKMIVVAFDFIALLLNGGYATVVIKQMQWRTMHDPIVFNSTMPIVLFFLYFTDLWLTCVFFQDELELSRIIYNNLFQMMTLWVSRQHMIIAPVALFPYAVLSAGLLVGAMCGRDMLKLMVIFFDFLALLLFASYAIVVVSQMEQRTMHDPIVLNGAMPIVTFFLFFTDLWMTCVFFQDELELNRIIYR